MCGRILIVDAGGTSTKWSLCSASGCAELATGGINAAVSTPEEIRASASEASHVLSQASEIYFYGAGCVAEFQQERVRKELAPFVAPEAVISLHSDLVAAGRALFGSGTGVACILGTGSNCGMSDGGDIIGNVPPLGYILGDEGGGAHLGKEFLKRLMRKEIKDRSVIEYFNNSVGMDYAELIERVYHAPSPNHFFASLAPILYEFRELPEIKDIIDVCIRQFFNNCVSRYSDSGVRDIGFIGSLAKAFEANISVLCRDFGMRLVKIDASPMEGLKKYHLSQLQAQ